MSRRRSLLALALAVVVLASVATPVAADPSLSITGVSVPDSVTQGDSFDLTVSVSGDELQNSEADVALTLPDGLSCSPSGSQTVTLSGGTGSATFDCTADLEGDYTGEITVSASGTNTNDGSSLSDSTQSGLEVISPASLTLSSALDTDTVDEGDSTTLTVVVQNAGDAATSYQLSQAGSSGYSTSMTSGSASGTIGGDETRTVEYSVTGDSGGDYTLTTTLTAGNGQELQESESLTVEAASGGGGGGGGSSNQPPVADASATVDAVTAGAAFTLDGSNSTDDVGIDRYEWDVDDDGSYEKTGVTATHTYNDTGDKTVTLRVFDGSTETTDTITLSVTASTSQTVTDEGTATPTETTTDSEADPTDGDTPDGDDDARDAYDRPTDVGDTDADSDTPTTTGSGGPGFTVTAALLALAGAAFLARRR